jgi:Undecaprenyl-phosphate galactose phosphotransferase WbaP
MVHTKSWQATKVSRKGWNSEVARIALILVDFLAVASSFLLAEILLKPPIMFNAKTILPLLVAFLWPFIYWREGLYPGYGISRPEKFQKYVIGALLAGWLLLVLKPFLSNEFGFTYTYLILSTALSVFLTYPSRLVMQRVLFRLGVWGEPVIIFGAGDTGKRVANILSNSPLMGLIPIAMFDDDLNKIGSRVANIPVLGSLAEAGKFAYAKGIQHAIIAIPKIDHKTLSGITNENGQIFKKVQFIPHVRSLPVHSVGVSTIDNYLALEFYNNLRLRRNQFFKRSLDILGATVGSVVISPILLFLALLIKLDSKGSVVYSQKRIGRHGKHFQVYKFRSMVHNADEVLHKYLEQHPELRAEWQATHKLKDDPRVTRVGRLLRKYSLDELPQLWNVIKGDMSLVGPRPIVDAEISKYQDAFGLYCLARPGMTGYWQVSGRSDTSYEHRVELDSFYIRNWSIWLDIIILIATIRVVGRGNGAY